MGLKRSFFPASLNRFLLLMLAGVSCIVSLLFFQSSYSPSSAATVAFNPAFGMVKVTDYGLVGNGSTDNTAKLQQLIQSQRGSTLYFPRGTYLIRGAIDAGSNNTFGALSLLGEDVNQTIIKLQDNLPAFNQATPKAMFSTSEGNTSFKNYIRNLTFNTGSGNRNAIGLDYISNNNGTIDQVLIRSEDGGGAYGIYMGRAWPGPSLVRNVQIIGFNYGLFVNQPHYSVTVEHLKISGQSKAGVVNCQNILTIRDLQSVNAVPAIVNLDENSPIHPNCASYGRGFLTVVDSVLRGANATTAAIVNEKKNTYFLRNINSTGYAAVLSANGVPVNQPTVTELVTDPVLKLHGSLTTSLNLPVAETPPLDPGDPATDWAIITAPAYGAVSNDDRDDFAAIQKAINSGRRTVIFPAGKYYIGRPLLIDRPVNFISYGASIAPSVAAPGGYLNGVTMQENRFFVKVTSNDTTGKVYFYNFDFNQTSSNGYTFTEHPFSIIQHTGKTDVVLKDVTLNGKITEYSDSQDINQWGYEGGNGAGNLYVEDYCCGHIHLKQGQQMWARQLNIEGDNTHLVNEAGTAWILGFKTEGAGTLIDNRPGAVTEILGGMFYGTNAANTTVIGIKNDNASLSLSYATNFFNNQIDFNTHIQDKQAGSTKTLTRNDIGDRVAGKVAPLVLSTSS